MEKILTAIVLTKNEEKNIDRCLKSLLFCDEIIVIDDYSEDNTVNIAQKYPAKIYRHSLNDDFAGQRNFALTKARGSWILFIDADEFVTPQLATEIRSVANSDTTIKGFLLRREDFIFGEKIKSGEIGNRLLRFARKDAGEWSRKVHEVWNVKGDIGLLRNPIQHFPHQTLKEFVYKINMYSTMHAQSNFEEGKRSSLAKIIIWPMGKFMQLYIIKGGIIDKTTGLVIALLMSLHSFLAWSKLWLTQRRKR